MEDVGIDLSRADMCMLLEHKGRISGYYNIVNADNFKENILDKLKKDLTNAKCVIVSFLINKESTVNIDELILFMKDIINDECSYTFSTDYEEKHQIDKLEFTVLMSGLK